MDDNVTRLVPLNGRPRRHVLRLEGMDMVSGLVLVVAIANERGRAGVTVLDAPAMSGGSPRERITACADHILQLGSSNAARLGSARWLRVQDYVRLPPRERLCRATPATREFWALLFERQRKNCGGTMLLLPGRAVTSEFFSIPPSN